LICSHEIGKASPPPSYIFILNTLFAEKAIFDMQPL